jgi:lipid II:glycine glycyltransferase (peptidoglycan interpeptide bridge formation enzyme)
MLKSDVVSPSNAEDWDQFLDASGGAFDHTTWWLQSLSQLGARAHVVTIRRGGGLVGGSAVLEMRVPVLGTSALVIRGGPYLSESSPEVVRAYVRTLSELADSTNAFVVQLHRIESGDIRSELSRLMQGPHVRHEEVWAAFSGSNRELRIPLIGHTEQSLLASFRKKTRYSIRKAEKAGLEVVSVSEDSDLETAYSVWDARSGEKGYVLRPYASLRTAMRGAIDAGQGMVLLGRHDGNVASAIFVTMVGSRANYTVGGLRSDYAHMNATHLLQWRALQICLARGMVYYSLGADSAGSVGSFKHGFRPEVWDAGGTIAWIRRPLVLKMMKALARPELTRFVKRAVRRRVDAGTRRDADM